MSGVQDITTDIPSGKKAVLLFWAPWHEASVEGGTMGQVLTALAAANSTTAASGDVLFGRVQAEDCPSLTEKYKVTAVPTFVLVNTAGDVVARLEGDEDVASVTQAVQNLVQSPNSIAAAFVSSEVKTLTPQERLTKRIETLIRSSNVMAFMKGQPGAPRCGFSRQLVELLQEEKIPFGSFDILSDEEVRQGLKAHSNWPTYPQLYVNGELIGGLDIVKELKEEGPTLREQLGIPADTFASSSTTQEERSLEDRLAKLIRRHKIMVFMKGLPSAPRCGFSRQIVEMLDDLGVAYDTFNILEDEEVRQGLKKFSDWPTYPQVYVNGELIGGLDIVKEMVESGEIDSILDAK